MLVLDKMCRCKDEKNGSINQGVSKRKCILRGVKRKRMKESIKAMMFVHDKACRV